MTTTVTVQSHNYPALIETFDSGQKTGEKVIGPSDGVVTFHCTTTRELRVTDLEYEDARVPERFRRLTPA